jgi:hypothetical protein
MQMMTYILEEDFDEVHGLTKLYICGDHGPHFCGRRTFFFESTLWRRFGIEICCHFLCSYHAYNRCDGEGALVKRAAKRVALEGGPKRDAAGYADLVNGGELSECLSSASSIAISFEAMDRDLPYDSGREGKYPSFDEHDRNGVVGLRTVCEVKYSFLDANLANVFKDGVCLVRECSGSDEPYTVWDLMPSSLREEGPMCQICSNLLQRPLYHGADVCPKAAANQGRKRRRPVQGADLAIGSRPSRVRRREQLTQPQLTILLRENSLPVSGRRKEQVDRLFDNGICVPGEFREPSENNGNDDDDDKDDKKDNGEDGEDDDDNSQEESDANNKDDANDNDEDDEDDDDNSQEESDAKNKDDENDPLRCEGDVLVCAGAHDDIPWIGIVREDSTTLIKITWLKPQKALAYKGRWVPCTDYDEAEVPENAVAGVIDEFCRDWIMGGAWDEACSMVKGKW